MLFKSIVIKIIYYRPFTNNVNILHCKVYILSFFINLNNDIYVINVNNKIYNNFVTFSGGLPIIPILPFITIGLSINFGCFTNSSNNSSSLSKLEIFNSLYSFSPFLMISLGLNCST